MIKPETTIKECLEYMKNIKVNSYELVKDPSGTLYFANSNSLFEYYFTPNFLEEGEYYVQVYWNEEEIYQTDTVKFKELNKKDIKKILSDVIYEVEKKKRIIKDEEGHTYLIPQYISNRFSAILDEVEYLFGKYMYGGPMSKLIVLE